MYYLNVFLLLYLRVEDNVMCKFIILCLSIVNNLLIILYVLEREI